MANLAFLFLGLHLAVAAAQSTAPAAASSPAPADPIAAFKSGDYKTAIPLLQQAAAGPEKTDQIRAALLSALVYEGSVDEASDLASSLETDAPNSPDALTARGDYTFYMGDIGAAEALYRNALKLREETARAYLGLYRVFRAASLYKTARTFALRAHAIDPDDALVTFTFLQFTVGDIRRQQLGPFMDSHPWFAHASFYQVQEQNSAQIHRELEEQHAFELQGAIHETTVPLSILLSGPSKPRGLAIQVSIAGGKPLRLMLDTGASGIYLTQQAVDRAGLKHIGSAEHWGIGDGGTKKGFFAVADTCSVGTLEFKRCLFGVQEGKSRIAGEDDGLIGTDFFANYVIHLDFKQRNMLLRPLPPRPYSPQGYDREIPPDETDFTRVFRFGHTLCIPTIVNRKSTGLFVLDTGSSASLMDATFARLFTKVHHNDFMRVHGISGNVKEVFEADKAELQFAHFRQNNLGLTTINLNNSPRHQDVRMSGILGLPVLTLFRLDIDYRNGLVKFDYQRP